MYNLKELNHRAGKNFCCSEKKKDFQKSTFLRSLILEHKYMHKSKSTEKHCFQIIMLYIQLQHTTTVTDTFAKVCSF